MACLSLACAWSVLTVTCPKFSAASFLHFVFLKCFCLGQNKKISLYKGLPRVTGCRKGFRRHPSAQPPHGMGSSSSRLQERRTTLKKLLHHVHRNLSPCTSASEVSAGSARGCRLIFPTCPTQPWKELVSPFHENGNNLHPQGGEDRMRGHTAVPCPFSRP